MAIDQIMTTPPEPIVTFPSVVAAWLAVMDEVTAVGKDGLYEAGRTRYNFRGIDGVVNAVGPALRKHGVFITPTVLEATYRDAEAGKDRTLMRECTVKVRYTVTGPGGDSFSGEVYGEALDSSDKGTAKATSVAYRIFLLQALTIPTHEPDPDESRHERSAVREPEPPVPGFRSSLMAATEGLTDAERELLRAWLKEEGLPDRPSLMDAEQADRVCEWLIHGLPKVEPAPADAGSGSTSEGNEQ